MKSTHLAYAAVACALVLASPLRAADLAGAKAFLAQLYAHYPAKSGARPFDPLGRQAASVFDPSFVALLREDARLTPPGDVGAIDWDPICGCQDDDGMKTQIGAIRPVGPSAATALVEVRFAGVTTSDRIALDLVVDRGQWRIHDIRTKDVPSLRADLIKSNRAAAAKGHHR
jgi:hypothetical protein